jgi:hypothetical protein
VTLLRDLWFDYQKEAIEGRRDDTNEQEWISLALKSARSAGVEDPEDPESIEFLLRAPHIFTMDEVQLLAQLPVAEENGLPGIRTEMVPPFAAGPPRLIARPATGDVLKAGPQPDTQTPAATAPARIRIGREIDRHGLRDQDEQLWHHLPLPDLAKHALIVGSTGSGKTVTSLFIIRELLSHAVPILIIEPVKTEYYRELRHIHGATIIRRRLEGTSNGGKVSDFLAFDPMRLQPGVSVARHASYLKSCFEAAFPVSPNSPEAMLLEAGIRSYYTDPRDRLGCGLELFARGSERTHHTTILITIERPRPPDPTTGARRTPERFYRVSPYRLDKEKGEKAVYYEKFVMPSLAGFRRFFSLTFLPQMVNAQGGQRVAELLETWRQFFERRFEALDSGMIGYAAKEADALYLEDESNYDLFGKLLLSPTIVELDGIPDDEQKALMMAFLTAFLFERRQAEDLLSRELEEEKGFNGDAGRAVNDGTESQRIPALRHVLILEEAHRILPNSVRSFRPDAGGGGGAQAKSVSLFVDMLAEIRAFGQGLIIVEQIPTKIVPEAVKNTNLKIMLRLTAADDREFLGAAMNFTEQQKRFVTSLSAEEGRGVHMAVFEQQADQPKLLMLPLSLRRETPIHASLFEQGRSA